MAKISMATIRALINYLSVTNSANGKQSQVIFRTQLLNEIKITELQLNNSSQLVDSSKYETLFTFAEHQLKIKNIGFEFGKMISADRWGILGYIAFTSPTLKVALQKQRKYQSLAGNLGTPISEIRNERLLLKWIPAYQCNHHIVEEIITGWATLAANLSQNIIKPSGIYFQHSLKNTPSTDEKEQNKIYEGFFGCTVKFEHDFNGIEITQSSLDIPLTSVDEVINQTLCQQADNMLGNIIEQSPIESVNQFIINQLPLGVPEIDDIAKQLSMSTRTLQRKLSDNHLNFTGMIDSIRKNLALSYLQNTNTKVIYIAQMLGFSEQSAFQRAFKRWTAQTPKQYRNNTLKLPK